jgi:hypothetical protein
MMNVISSTLLSCILFLLFSFSDVSFVAGLAIDYAPNLSLLSHNAAAMSVLLTTTATVPTSASAIDQGLVDEARTSFVLWFFGGSGAAGIARSAFPRMYLEVRRVQSLKGQGPTLGGETMNISPFVGYPQDLYVLDVEAVVSNPMTVEDMVRKYPVENNFLAAKGYLTFQAFAEANKDRNPLAVRAVFDTFATSTDTVEPDKAQDLLNEYKSDVRILNSKLLKSKLVGYSSIITLLFLLGYADSIAAGHLYNGWFPQWPGGQNFPFSLLDEGGGLWRIPQYWI